MPKKKRTEFFKVTVGKAGVMHLTKQEPVSYKTLCGKNFWATNDHSNRYCVRCQRILAKIRRIEGYYETQT